MIKYLHVETDNAGVNKKIDNQVKALNQLGVNVVKEKLEKEQLIKRLIPFQTSSANWGAIDTKGVDGLFIRYPFSDYQFIRFLKKFRCDKQDSRVIIEIPTYPNNGEKYSNKIVIIRDYFYRRFLKKYIDHIVYEGDGDYKEIFGIPSTKIINGIDVDSVPIKNDREFDGIINLICVASFNPEYGMERLISGMRTYFQSSKHEYDIVLHLVGRGQTLSYYKDLAKEYGLENKVILHGYKTGKELDELFDKADIGVDALAFHRKGLKNCSTLKTREYLARGIPFIYSCGIPELTADMEKYTLFFEQNDDEISVDRIIEFYKGIAGDDNRNYNIRSIAKRTVEMSIVMEPVAELYEKKEV